MSDTDPNVDPVNPDEEREHYDDGESETDEDAELEGNK